jgi:hypothetical protein
MTRTTRTLLAALLLAGCSSQLDFAEPTVWHASLSGVGLPPSQITGTFGAVSSGFNTHASIGITEAEPGNVHPWLVRTGTCGTTGAIFGARAAYPVLTVPANGIASAEAGLSQLLDADGTYQVQLLESPTSDDVVACGNLVLTSS